MARICLRALSVKECSWCEGCVLTGFQCWHPLRRTRSPLMHAFLVLHLVEGILHVVVPYLRCESQCGVSGGTRVLGVGW